MSIMYVLHSELVRLAKKPPGATEHYKMATVDMDISSLKAEINGYVMKLQEAEDTGNQKTWAELITARSLVLKSLLDEKAGELTFILHLQFSP